MSYKSKRTIASMGAGALLVIAYIVYVSGGRAPQAEDLKGWATLILVFIAIGIAANILVQILFHIGYSIGVAINEKLTEDKDDKEVERIISSAMVEDEMDAVIALKATRVGYILAGIGFVATLVALALGESVVVALHILTGSLCAGSFLEGCTSVYLYERGV